MNDSKNIISYSKEAAAQKWSALVSCHGRISLFPISGGYVGGRTL